VSNVETALHWQFEIRGPKSFHATSLRHPDNIDIIRVDFRASFDFCDRNDLSVEFDLCLCRIQTFCVNTISASCQSVSVSKCRFNSCPLVERRNSEN